MAAKEPWRTLSAEEASLLRFLLEHECEKLRVLLMQMEGLLARSSCACGCPSIEFQVSAESSPAISEPRIITDDVYGYSDGKLVVTFLIIDDGKLSEMETYDVAGQFQGKYGLPDLSTLSRDTSLPMQESK
jgi:hypothetical protein